MKLIQWRDLDSAQREAVLARPVQARAGELSTRVAAIIAQVRQRGDAAILKFTETFDRVRLKDLCVTRAEIRSAYETVDRAVLAAMKDAIGRIEAFHRVQMPNAIRIETAPGVVCERIFRPIARVGLYVPGGTAPLPSTVMMLGVPARIAGSPLRVMATPPRSDGSIDPYILVAADLLGIDRIYKVGGAQAIAALAFGTESIPKVDKVFGPGNSWVTEAKIQVGLTPEGAVSDLPAGPSEVLVVADARANARFIAADLLSQAEHGEDSQVVLVTDSRDTLEATLKEVERQVRELPREAIARAALSSSLAIVCEDMVDAFVISNAYAPEHLILHVANARQYLGAITNAGSVFLGEYSPESVGDYSSGTNHVLPTYGFARSLSGVTLESFMKSMSVQELTRDGLRRIGPGVELLAETEGLRGHRNAVAIRLASPPEDLQ